MRPIRLLILLLAIALALVLALLRPLQGRAERAPLKTRILEAPVAKLAPPPRHLMSVPASTGRLAFGHRIVSYARHLLGIRYSWGGTSPHTGFDCSGLVRYVYAHFGISLPHYSGAQFDMGRRVSRRGLRPGDLVFFDGIGHVGMYIGNGRFIHAPHTGTSVQISTLAGWYAARYDGARRLL